MPAHMILCVRLLLSSCCGAISLLSLPSWWLLVDHIFFASWSRWPFTATILFGRCFEIRDVVRPGHVVKCFSLIARIKVDGAGLKNAPERYCPSSCFVWSTLIIPLACKIGGLFEIGSLGYSIYHYHWVARLWLLCYFFRIDRLYLEKNATKLSLYSWPIDIRDHVARSSKM